MNRNCSNCSIFSLIMNLFVIPDILVKFQPGEAIFLIGHDDIQCSSILTSKNLREKI